MRTRAAHGALLCVYTLAAVLGLFLHASPDARGRHLCGARTPDLHDASEAPGAPDHDESRCALCHTHDRLSLALPVAARVEEKPLAVASLDLPARRALASAPVFVPLSRAPPSFPIA